MVPNSAVKSATARGNYVEIPDDVSNASQLLANVADSATGIALNDLPVQQMVEVGIANDSFTEITGGLKEGDIIVVRTIIGSANQGTNTQNRSLFKFPGARTGSGGGGTRIMAH